MNISRTKLPRLQFLARIVRKEIRHLRLTNQRLFPDAFTPEKAGQLETDVELAERVDAFVSRFGRLQDTVGDKLLPRYLDAVGEATGPAIDNLNRAEKLGLIGSAELWITLRDLRNEMIHEQLLKHKTRILSKLWERIGVQRIDIILKHRNTPLKAIHRAAKKTGIRL